MTCPLCEDTGYIKVILVDGEKKTGRAELKPCALGCKPFDGQGVGGNMGLEGSELSPPRDYKHPGETINWKSHYLGDDSE